MSINLDYLVKTLLGDETKFLSQELCGKRLELVKQTEKYLYEYINSFERFDKTKLHDKKDFYSSLKNMNIFLMKTMSMLWKFGMNLEWKYGRLSCIEEYLKTDI